MTAAWLLAALVVPAPQATAPVPYPDAPRLAYERFEALRAADSVVVVDVRSAEAYAAGHIPGALSVPSRTLEQRARELGIAAKSRTLVLYCA